MPPTGLFGEKGQERCFITKARVCPLLWRDLSCP